MRKLGVLTAAVALGGGLAFSAVAHAADVDLSTWTQEHYVAIPGFPDTSAASGSWVRATHALRQ